jgi:hypothetical protein
MHATAKNPADFPQNRAWKPGLGFPLACLAGTVLPSCVRVLLLTELTVFWYVVQTIP